jgi:hypothetical protein
MNALNNKKNEGSAFITTFIFGVILCVTAGSFLLMITNDYGLNHRSRKSAVAINLAEAGVDYAIWALPVDDDDTGAAIFSWAGEGTAQSPKSIEYSSFQTSGGEVMGDFYAEVVDPAGNNPLIESTGYVPGKNAPGNIRRTVKVKLKEKSFNPFSEVFFGDDSVKVHGGCVTDSYDSGNGDYGGDNVASNGDIATNGTIDGAIELDGTVTINGDARTGPEGTVSGEVIVDGEPSHPNVTGEISHDIDRDLPDVEVPSQLVNSSYYGGDGLLTLTGTSSQSLDSGDYKMRRIKLTANAILTINGPARVYLTGYVGKSIFQTGSAQIICNGDVEFYADSDLDIGGNGITNSGQIPSNLKIWGTPSCTNVNIDGASAFYGAVYASNAEIDVTGSEDAFGSFVGKVVDCGGGAVYHYDEALGEVTAQGKGHDIIYWEEKE